MGKRARWILVGVVLLAVVGVGWMKARRPHEPVVRFALSDGTELRLEYVTYGTDHRIAGVGKMGAFSASIARDWLHLRLPNYVAEYHVITETACPVLWFTVVDPQTGKRYEPKIDSVSALGQPGDVRMRTNGGSSSSNAPFPSAAYPLTAFPRRAESIRLRVDVGGQIMEGDIPNPVRGQSFETWKPEPVPQTRRVGTREFTLNKLTLHRWTDGPPKGRLQFGATYTIREASGEEAHEFNVGSELLDATGNKHIEVLPMDEPAWKIRAYFHRTGDYPFGADEGLILGPVEMPGPGEFREFEIPAAEKKNGIRFAALVGKGRYVWEDGKYVTGAAAVPVPGEANGAYGPGSHVRLVQNFSEPALMLLLDGKPSEKWLKSSGQIVVRLHSGGNGYQMSDGGGSGSTDGNGNQKVEKQFCAPSDKQNHRVSLSGPVSIQIVPVEPEIVDFIVAPPPQPSPR